MRFLAKQPTSRLIAVGLVVAMAVLWIVTETLPTLLTPGYSLLQVVWMRYGFHLLLMLLVLGPRRGASLLRTRRPALQLGRGLLMVVMPVSFIAALGYVHVVDVMAVFWLAPILLLCFAALVLRERPRWTFWVAATAGILGAELIDHPDAALAQAVPFGLGMGISFSLYVVLTRALRDERTATNLLYTALAVFVPLTLVMPAVWRPITLQDAALMAVVGAVGLALLWCIDRATELAPITVLAPVFPIQLALLAFLPTLQTGVRPPRLALLGTLLVVGAAVAGWLLPLRRAQGPAQPQPATAPVESV